MKRIFITILSLILLGSAFTFTSCLKKDYDTPPDQSGYDPNLTVTHTIAQLQSMPQAQITQDVVIAGIVCMDDRSGNYYKKIVIEDSTGGIEVHIDQSNLYADYPVGRKIYIKCKGLYLGSYHSLLQLGSTPDETGSITNINGTTVSDYVVKANFPNKLKVDTLTYAQLKDPAQNAKRLNTLVVIKDVQFADADAGVVYCSPSTSTSRHLATCSASGDIVLRSSNYANFQPVLTPTGQGFIVGVYTRYDADAQIVIRDTSDVQFTNPRCGAGGGGGNTGDATLITIDSAIKQHVTDTVIMGAYKITGVVISDKSLGNYQSKNVVVQQGNRGVVLRFLSDHAFSLGDSITVNVTGAMMTTYFGLLQISNIPTASASKSGTGTIVPQVATIQQINSNYTLFESTLVKIANVTFPSGTYSGNKVLNDGSGTITLYTTTSAIFKDNTMPAGTKTVTGIIGQYNGTKQIQIRNPATDIQ